MEIEFLGTGAGIPSKHRNVSSLALKLLQERGTVWLFDCGEATQHQMLHTTLKPRKVENIFVTHLHGDHVFGLPGFLGSRSNQGGEEALTVFAPYGMEAFLHASFDMVDTRLAYPLHIQDVTEGLVFEDKQFRVTAKRLEHGVECYGYRIEEKPSPGAFLIDKARAAGIPEGPIYRELKEGKTVTLSDGRTVEGSDFLSEEIPGRIVTILGDTRFCQASIELAKDADVLVHEATFADGEDKRAHDYYHSTCTQAATVAKEAGAKKLILNHLSARYDEDGRTELEEQARRVFPETYVANDGFIVEVLRGKGS
ncbi:ribonuclease Z [Bacillus fonticola]|uniref:ribonuclease Z n=1 Tax=Bacillus fonticola TaxID=2728853 RepID=UPI0014758072|nr:ribonuclease Z [Bacillus fonticola]